jgi:DNA-binding transcriptional LysR family regulator
VAPKSYRAPRVRPTLADLAAERFLLREAGSGTRMAIDEHLARAGVQLSQRMTVGSNLREITILEVRGFPIEREWHVVHWRDQMLSTAAEAFRGYLLEFAAEMRKAARAAR